MRRLELFIQDIADEIESLECFTRDLNKHKFISNKLYQNAIIRSLEIIGEAVKNIPTSFRNKYPDIEWKKIAGFRDRTTHAYFNLDLDITWDIIKDEIPSLKKQIQRIKDDLEAEKNK